MSDALQETAVAAFRSAVGDEHVLESPDAIAPYEQNVTGLAGHIPLVIRPATTYEVQQVVLEANRHRVALYPISCGKNWGLGSRLPVREGCAVLDLGRMNRIHEVNPEQGYAVVEPGVTQEQLYRELEARELPLVINVTGSSKHTSLIGNALERGIGYFASRADELSGLEVVLGDGRILQTGFGHYDAPELTHCYRYGHGPFLDGLFAQGNFGVVTRAGVALMCTPEARAAVLCRLPDESALARYVDALAGLYRDGVIRTVTHIGNRHRTEIALGPLIRNYLVAKGRTGSPDEVRAFLAAEGYADFSGLTGVHGSAAMVRTAVSEIRKALRGIVRPVVLTDPGIRRRLAVARALRWIPWFDRKLAVFPSIAEIQRLAQGIPTSEPMRSVYDPVGLDAPDTDAMDPDQGRAGMIYFLPMIPLSGDTCQQAAHLIQQVFNENGFIPYITFNIIHERALEAVLNVAFDRSDPEQTERAHQTIQTVETAFRSRGWLPYRLGTHAMPKWIDSQDPFWNVARDIKHALDPNLIISPGRYNPD